MRLDMRWIGPSLLALSLAFSTGGVAIVGQAGSTADASSVDGKGGAQQSVTPVEQSDPTQATPSQCEAPPGFRRTESGKPRELKDAPDNKSIVLNTSGYNYVLEGEWRPDPTAKPQNVPEGVLPKEHETATPPAAHEAK
jgi:hypothetical protein